MGKRFITLLILLFSNLAWSSPRITYTDFLTMPPEKQKEVVKLLMKSYATFEEIQRRDGITLEQKMKIKQTFNMLNLILSKAYAQEYNEAIGPLTKEEYQDKNNQKSVPSKLLQGPDLIKLRKDLQEKAKKLQEEILKNNSGDSLYNDYQINENQIKDNKQNQKLDTRTNQFMLDELLGQIENLLERERKNKPETKKENKQNENEYIDNLINSFEQKSKNQKIPKVDEKEIKYSAPLVESTDPNQKCIYAGWYSNINPGRKTCIHPSLGNPDYHKNQDLNFDNCKGTGKIVCNPMLYGHKPNKEVICVGGNDDSQNSSLACWNKASKLETETGLILDSVLKLAQKNPKAFADLLETVFNMCLCGEDDGINDHYAHRMQRHRTCYGILKQASDISELVKSCTIEDGKLVLGGSNKDNITDFEYIHENLTNFFDEVGDVYEPFAKDNSFKKGSKEWNELAKLDKAYSEKWENYRPEDKKCDLLDRNKKVVDEDPEVVEPEKPFNYSIEIKFTKNDPYAKEAEAEAIIKDSEGEIIEDPAAEGLKVVWYKAEDLLAELKKEKKAKEEKSKNTSKEDQEEVILPDSNPNTNKEIETKTSGEFPGYYAFGFKEVKFIRKLIKSEEDVKGYPVRAILVRGDNKELSNELIIKPVTMPPQNQGPGGPGVLRGGF